jgi:hypothetical protein
MLDMTDEMGFGVDLRRQGNLDILEGKRTFRYMIPSSHRPQVYHKEPVSHSP